MCRDPINHIIQRIKIRAWQLHGAGFIGMPVEYLRAVIVVFRFENELAATVHDLQFIIRVIGDAVDQQKVVNAIAIG